MRPVLNEDDRRLMPWTTYPLPSSNSARYAPSCPVAPVISATRSFIVSDRIHKSEAHRSTQQEAACLQSFRRLANPKSCEGIGSGANGSDFVVFAIPIDESAHTLSDRRARREADSIFQAFDISVGRGHVARLHRGKFANRRLSDRRLDKCYNLQNLDRTVVTNIVHAPRSTT